MRLLPALAAPLLALALAAAADAATPTFAYVQTLGTAVRNQDSPSVAIDNAGNAIAVWAESDNLDTGIHAYAYTAYRPAGRVFGAARRMSAAGVHAQDVRVAMNARGDAVAAWFIRRGSAGVIEASVRPAGPTSRFGRATTVATLTGGAFALPYVAIDPAGNAIVGWSVSDAIGSTAGMFASYRPFGGAFGPLEVANPVGYVANAAMMPDGTAVLVSGGPSVTMRTPGPAGTWGPLTPAVLPSQGGDTAVATNARGDLAIAYIQRTPGGTGVATSQIAVTVRRAGGVFSSPPSLLSPPVISSPASGTVSQPTVAISDVGQAAVTWLDATGPLSPGPDPVNLARIASATAIPGGGVSSPVPIRASFGVYGNFFTTATSSDGSGNFVVMGAHNRALEYQLRLGGGIPGPAHNVAVPSPSPDVPGPPGELALAENRDGDAVVVYALGSELVQAAYDVPAPPVIPPPVPLPPGTGVKGTDAATLDHVTVRTRFDVASTVDVTGTIKLPHKRVVHLATTTANASAGILETVRLQIRKRDQGAVRKALAHGKVSAHVRLRAVSKRGKRLSITTRTIQLHR